MQDLSLSPISLIPTYLTSPPLAPGSEVGSFIILLTRDTYLYNKLESKQVLKGGLLSLPTVRILYLYLPYLTYTYLAYMYLYLHVLYLLTYLPT